MEKKEVRIKDDSDKYTLKFVPNKIIDLEAYFTGKMVKAPLTKTDNGLKST